MHLHGIVIREQYQGKGIGTRAMGWIAENYRGEKAFIELGVQRDNHRAISLYEKLGYRLAGEREELGFHILRKDLGPLETGERCEDHAC